MRLVITADDFGSSSAVNEAVAIAHREGVLTSASLMVAGEVAEEAVAMARATPTLAVGLHLVLAGGRPVLGPDRIPHLVNADGELEANPARAGWRYFRDRRCRAELAEEIRAQFERYAATGLELTHVDGHMQLHMHPSVFELVAELAEQYGARGIRLPVEPKAPQGIGERPTGMPMRRANAIAAGVLARWCRARLRGRQLASTIQTIGLTWSGRMTEPYVQRALASCRGVDTEIYFHPTTGEHVDDHGANRVDLRTLLSPAVRRVIEDRGWRLGSYRDLAEAATVAGVGRAAEC